MHVCNFYEKYQQKKNKADGIIKTCLKTKTETKHNVTSHTNSRSTQTKQSRDTQQESVKYIGIIM